MQQHNDSLQTLCSYLKAFAGVQKAFRPSAVLLCLGHHRHGLTTRTQTPPLA
jgi:hypothetical protein